MRAIGAIAVGAILLGSCTGLRPVDAPPQNVREQVRAGQVARAGEHISATTEDGATHEFEVVEVTDHAIRGHAAEVPIDKVVSLRTKQIDPARTALAGAGVVGILYAAFGIHAMNEMIDDILDALDNDN